MTFSVLDVSIKSILLKKYSRNSYLYNINEIKRFCQRAAEKLPLSENVYAFSGCAAELFHKRNGLCVLDQTALLPLDEIDLFKKTNLVEPSSSWLNYMNFLHERNLFEIDRSNTVLCLYPQVEESVRKWRPNANTKIIMHPCDAPVQKRYMPHERLRFLFAGQKSIVKGIYLIEKWLNISTESTKIDFVICGPEGNYNVDGLRSRNGVQVLGRQNRDQLNDLFKSADLCVFPEQQNALGNTAFEAMEHGTSVLARQNSLIIDKKNGFTFGDDDNFYSVMNFLANQKPEYLFEVGTGALEIATRRFNSFNAEIKNLLGSL
ncbi:glycosyltransferase [Aromatoleum aromaticum]|uniref:glycosyltransferase n=1 Tax=Aromatoleum aromaticum TaxID=551760 RepID=UPI00145929D0|nr:glycosyltransferase [Aromatoleum aromaticum]NMG55438.1 glycosyltransferase [Aromatoleum aromaticum]